MSRNEWKGVECEEEGIGQRKDWDCVKGGGKNREKEG